MDLVVLEKGLKYMRRNKKWAIVLGTLGFTGYGAYRMYNSPSVVKKRERLLKLLGAFVSIADIVSDSAETVGIVSKEIKEFIQSDSNEIPQSMKQISKITSSNEFSESLTKITRALTVGILQGNEYGISRNGDKGSGFVDRAMNKLFSDAGAGFVSVVVGSLARNLVMAFYSQDSLNGSSKWNKSAEKLIFFACESDQCRELIGDCIRVFVSTAMTVYLEKTMDINTYDDIFSALTNPKHENEVKDLLVSVCNGGIETLIRTSHQLWMENYVAASNCYKKHEFEDGFGDQEKTKLVLSPMRTNGWVSKVSSTLSVPSNRKFILHVTGMVTFETIRSFLEFLLEKLSECVKRSVDIVNQEVVDRGLEAMRYMSGKPSAVASVCLTLCFHILNSPWILAPASH